MGDESVKGGGEQSGGGGGGGGGMSLEQYQVLGGHSVPVQVSGPGQLPTLAPAPVGQPGLHMPAGGSVPGSQGGGVQQQPGINMQQAMGQPQFQVIQPSYPGGGQYATIPQVATYNSQGQLVLQPAFGLQPGLPGQGQLILSGVPQPQPQPGKPGLMASQPSTPSKPGMQYTMTSSGQLQMQPGTQPTFIMAPQPMGSPLPGQVNMPGPGQQVVPSTMAGMKGGEGKAMMTAPQPQSGQQQFLLPNGQMAYMQPGPSTQPILQNGQLIFRSPGGPEGQQLMFSPGGPPTGPPQVPQTVPAASTPLQMQSPMPQIPQMSRASSVPTAPPGKTAISRAIAPLPPSVSQAGPRLGLHQTAGMPGQAQASPAKSKQKMSPRGNNVGPGRPPGPKNLNTPKMMPKLPGGPESVVGGKPSEGVAGPPTLLPQMLPAQPVALSTTVAPAPPHSMLVSMPPMPVKPLYQMSSSIPTSTVTPMMSGPPADGDKAGLGPPTLTKEINPPMPNLGPPNISGNNLGSKVLGGPTTTQPLPAGEQSAVQGLVTTPKAVVKPQVLTHVIDGHVIKESSTPFPVSPSKSKFVFQIANRRTIEKYFFIIPVASWESPTVFEC